MTSTIVLTGATGYLGSYVLKELLDRTDAKVAVLLRAKDPADGARRLWESMQLHQDASQFEATLRRVELVPSDLHEDDLGLAKDTRARLAKEARSILHVAAALNRRSEKACLNTNVRGLLSVIGLAKELKRLDRFGFVSTVAVAGHRQGEVVDEDHAIEWDRSDYDPYARTKKLGEHLVRTLLPGAPITIYRPSIVMGDGHHPRTMQFDMIRATFTLAELPVVPLRPEARLDIVNAAYVGEAIARIHLAPKPKYDCYHLSSGTSAPTARSIQDALRPVLGNRTFRLVPGLDKTFEFAFRAMTRAPRKSVVAAAGTIMKAWWPYVTFDTVFDNRRVVEELGHGPVPFESYAAELYQWCKAHRYAYPHVAWSR
jgi:thioester reductase-like protein